MQDDIVVIGREPESKKLAVQATSPTFVKCGTGGKRLRLPNGREIGPIDGEALRLALGRGAVIIGEEKRQEFTKRVGAPGTPRAGHLLE